jgi:hypothetical protein
MGILQEQENVRLNPEAQITHRQENTRGLVSATAIHLFETGRQRRFLHFGWQLRQQKRIAHADLFAVEDIDNLLR